MTNDNLLQSTSGTKAINSCSLSKGGHIVVVHLSLLLNANWKAKRLFYNRLKWYLITLAYKYKCRLKILDIMPNVYKLKWMYKRDRQEYFFISELLYYYLDSSALKKWESIQNSFKKRKKSASFFIYLSETFESVFSSVSSQILL